LIIAGLIDDKWEIYMLAFVLFFGLIGAAIPFLETKKSNEK
jgi:hypothetical protein